ncbi:MAG: GHKL domain-containing protein [Spiribacter salinus]|uniref:histidine kinase n=1 Tax=Spiribacter salinus TaxID=1335746 RepID=A0A540VU11_9GAMM|nr:MAG: GHKL domain-containing protein [Spiribacter salinus]
MTFSLTTLFIGATVYLSLLFLVAHASERGWIPSRIVRHPAVYVLSLGVYATTWSYYGSVGFAGSSGLVFITIYVGVTLAFALTPVLLMPLLRLTRRHQLTSVADLFAFRFDSQLAGILVTLMILTGSLPYLALQVRAVSESTQILTGDSPPQLIAIVFCVIVTVFAIIFGARHVTPREKHSGLVAAIAFESVVKMAALVFITGLAVSMAFGHWGGLQDWLNQDPRRLSQFTRGVGGGEWTGLMFLAFAAAFLLPRQFHMLFTENLQDAGLRTASWAFPLFLLVIAAATPPLLWSGQVIGLDTPTDYTVLGIAQLTESPAVALFVYLGGISAASAMIIVSTLALSSMCLNHLVLPLVRLAPLGDLYGTLRWVRRMLIVAIIGAGYFFYLTLERSDGLVSWGLISFLAMAQLIPGVMALLYWPGATRSGFIAGLVAGGSLWGIAGLFPALSTVGPIEVVGVDLLAAQTPAHFGSMAFWSVSANLLVFIAVSTFTRQDRREVAAAGACRDVSTSMPSGALLATSPQQFVEQLTPVMGAPAAEAEIAKALDDMDLAWSENRPDRLHQLREQVQRNLSGMMGPVLARDIVDQCLRLDADSRGAIAQNVRLIEERLERSQGGLRGIAAELDTLRRYHRQILEDLPLGVVAITPAGHIARWNPAMDAMTGIRAPRVLSRHLREVPAPWGELLASFISEDSNKAYKRPLALPDQRRWLTLHKALIGGPAGDENGDQLVLLEDVTDVQRLEDELTHSERLASIGRLAAGVAHEIGNPVTGIACLAQELHEEDPDRARATQILEQTQRINHIVQTLVGYAHAGQVNEPRTPEPTDLAAVAEEAKRLVSLASRARALSFLTDIPAGLAVMAEHQRLVQVFVNFYSNAVDACEPGDEIRTTAKRQRDTVTIRITDSGHGIPAGIRDKVLEPFFTTKAPGQGTGLGLSLAYNIVSDYQGSLNLQPRRGRTSGTEVVIRLPVADLPGELQAHG